MFVPLRIHSVFSRGQGGLTLAEIPVLVRRKRIPAAALTDTGNVYGWAGWKRTAGEAGFKPLFGCELEIGSRTFVFLVRDRSGYSNLVEILNRREIGSLDGLIVIYVPDGAGPDLITAAGRTDPASGLAGEAGEAAVVASIREKTAAGDFYLGGDFSNSARVFPASDGMVSGDESGRVFSGLPVVWANPLKFVANPERLVLLRAIDRKIPFPPEREWLRRTIGLFGPDQETEAVRRFGFRAEAAMKRTFEAAEKCSFSFEDVVPNLPADVFRDSLRQVVMEKLKAAGRLDWTARQRARRELEIVERAGFGAYFLIVEDIVAFARSRGILHNLRGSGASSFLAYLLGISAVNPIEFDLYFERFLNPGRPEPPDIDLDFDSRRRDEVLNYVLGRYGSGKTGAAFVCSLKNFRARSALYETLRALGAPPEEARSFAGRIPLFAEPEYLARSTPAAGLLEAWKLAAGLQGVHHEVSLHVGGVIITPAPVDRFLPLETSAKGLRMTHFDRDAVEDLRLIKLDLLSVRGLAAVAETGRNIRLGSVPAEDGRVYAALAAGRTIGCFQVESPAMRNLLRRMKPRNIQELTQALALIRPGPTESGMKEELLKRRNGGRPRPAGGVQEAFLERILPETGGILLYEEQVMQVAERVAGMPPEEGDLVRRSLKRQKGGAPALREKFFREAGERGYAAGDLERLWRTLEKFSSYSFNKAHSASYASLAYKAVYLKLRDPVVYLTAVLNAGGGYYDLAEYVSEAVRNGIRILRPDVNRSGSGFEAERPAIRTGLNSIKGLGLKIIGRIIEERKTAGAFASVEDFLARVRPAKAELLRLIRAGALDSLEPRRTTQILNYFQGLKQMEVAADIGDIEKKKMLYESLGFLPEGDSLELFEGRRPELRIEDLENYAGPVVELVVRVIDARERAVDGRARAVPAIRYFYMFEDETGIIEATGQNRCVAYGSPPVCFIRGQVRRDADGHPRIHDCVCLRSF